MPASSGTRIRTVRARLTKSKIVDYPEIYASIAQGPFKFKQWYTNDYGGTSQDALYSEVGAQLSSCPPAFQLNLHAGYNFGEYWKNASEEYFDFSAGVGYTVGHFNVGLKYTTYGPGRRTVRDHGQRVRQYGPRRVLDRDHIPLG